MITLYVNTAGRLVTPEGGVLPAQDRPELPAGAVRYQAAVALSSRACAEHILARSDAVAIPDPGPWPPTYEGGGSYHFDVFVTSNESYTRQTKSFGS